MPRDSSTSNDFTFHKFEGTGLTGMAVNWIRLRTFAMETTLKSAHYALTGKRLHSGDDFSGERTFICCRWSSCVSPAGEYHGG